MTAASLRTERQNVNIPEKIKKNKNLTSIYIMYTITKVLYKYSKIYFKDFTMVKKLIQHGNSVALVIDKPILEMLKITNETTFELTTDGRNLILSPQNESTQENDVLHSLEKINKKYGFVLQKLGE